MTRMPPKIALMAIPVLWFVSCLTGQYETSLVDQLVQSWVSLEARRVQIIMAWHLCFFPILCFHLVMGGVPGPCRHSVTQEHLWILNRLIDNQLDHDCLIIYHFTERLNLSKVCYVKAALPQVLELLRTQFHYGRNSDNRRYVSTLEKAIEHLYSQGCISEINEELEESPSRLRKVAESSPKEALTKAGQVIQMYMKLMTLSTRPVDWNCQSEYSVGDDFNRTQVALTSTTGQD